MHSVGESFGAFPERFVFMAKPGNRAIIFYFQKFWYRVRLVQDFQEVSVKAMEPLIGIGRSADLLELADLDDGSN